MKGVFKNWYLVFVIGFLLQGCKATPESSSELLGGISAGSDGSDSSAASGIGVSITSSEPATTGKLEIPITIQFDQAVKFKSSDVATSGGIVMNCGGSGATYNCTLIPKSQDVSVQVIAGSIKSSSGTPVASSNVLSFVVAAAEPTYGLCIKAGDYRNKYKSLRF